MNRVPSRIQIERIFRDRSNIASVQAGRSRYIMELLINPLANRYFSESGILGARKHFTELVELLDKLSVLKDPKLELLYYKKIEIDGLDMESVLVKAVSFINTYAKETCDSVPMPMEDLAFMNKHILDVLTEKDPEALVRNFFSLSNGFVDIGRMTDRLLINLGGIYCGYPEMAVKDFEGLYSILRAGYLIHKKEIGEKANTAFEKQPINPPPEIARASADPEYVDTSIRRPIMPVIGYAKKNGTSKYGDFVKELLFDPHHPELRAAIESAIGKYNKIREDGETRPLVGEFMAKIRKNDPAADETNFYQSEEAANLSYRQAQDILDAWKPGQDTKELQRLITLVLVLIKYPD